MQVFDLKENAARLCVLAAAILVFSTISASHVTAQTQNETAQKNRDVKNAIQETDNSDSLLGPDTLKLSGRFHLVSGTRKGFLVLKAEIPDGSYIYSTTQKGDIPPTTIAVKPDARFKITGNFTEDRTAEITPNDPIYNIRIEKHKRLVQFFVPIELAAGVDAKKLKPEMNFNGQICSEAGFCMPLQDQKISARFGGYFQQQAKKLGNKTQIR